MSEQEGKVNTAIKGIGSILGKFGKGKENKDTQRLYLDIPNEVIQKYIPLMLEEMSKSELTEKEGE